MNSPSWTPPASTGQPYLRNSTATPTGKPCAANGTTGGCRGSIPGGAALVWREPHLVAVATLLGRDIRSSPAWNSELLDIHRVRIDLERTLDDIYLRAHRVWRARANLVPPPSKDPADVVGRRNAEITAAAGDAWNTLVALVRQLQDYRKSLAPVDAIFAEIRALQQCSLRITDDAVRQLHVDAAGNTLHTGAVGAATVELADLNANLAARLATLRQKPHRHDQRSCPACAIVRHTRTEVRHDISAPHHQDR